MGMSDSKPILAGGGFVLGLILGLLYAWLINPAVWEGAGPQDLLPSYQQSYMLSVADSYEKDRDPIRVQQSFNGWPEAAEAICKQSTQVDMVQAGKLIDLVRVLTNGQDCATLALVAPETEESSPTWLKWVLGLFLFVLIGAVLYVVGKLGAASREAAFAAQKQPELMPTSGPTFSDGASSSDQGVTPVARFRTVYEHGHDTFDDSFSIETSSGDFLGECGVGISESIGTDSPKNVTALEVWLFDKNDIRTITKVIMSDHAFFDEAIKAKLAPKGEPVLARQGDTVVLETASLIINAEITRMDYGDSSTLPPQSYIEHIIIELSAWSKEGEYALPDIQGRIDEMLDIPEA